MNTLALKALADISLYFAVVMPLVDRTAVPVRIFLVLLPAVWVIWLIVNWEKRLLEASLIDTLYFEIRLLVVCTVIDMIAFGISRWQRTAVIFIAAFLIFAILCARTVRLEKSGSDNAAFRRNTLIEIAVVVAVAAILSFESVYGAVISFVKSFYNYIIAPVLEVILYGVLRFFMWAGSILGGIFPDISLDTEGEPIMLDLTAGLEEYGDVEIVGIPMWLKVVLIIIGIAIAAAIAVYIYRRLSERGVKDLEKTPGEISRSAIDIAGERKDGRRPFGAERNVRYYFRKLMAYGEKCGLNMHDGILTSDEAVKRESSLWGKEDELSELRDLYLAARYGGAKESDADKARAKEICNDIMKNRY